MARRVVLLPVPERPMITSTSPRFTSKETSRKISLAPKATLRFFTMMASSCSGDRSPITVSIIASAIFLSSRKEKTGQNEVGYEDGDHRYHYRTGSGFSDSGRSASGIQSLITGDDSHFYSKNDAF